MSGDIYARIVLPENKFPEYKLCIGWGISIYALLMKWHKRILEWTKLLKFYVQSPRQLDS